VIEKKKTSAASPQIIDHFISRTGPGSAQSLASDQIIHSSALFENVFQAAGRQAGSRQHTNRSSTQRTHQNL
jgi:hypothetical protein